MGWFGLCDQDGGLFDPGARADGPAGGDAPAQPPDALIARGSLLLETRLNPGRRPQTLLHYETSGAWPVTLSVRSVPGGGITFVLDQAGHLHHAAVGLPHQERLDTLQITYSWDAPRKWGRLAVQHVDSGRFVLAPVQTPPPLRLADMQALLETGTGRYLSPDAVFLAGSAGIEPVGPMPSLGAATPIATPFGDVPVARLTRGDTILTESGEAVPVLHRLARSVPARGSFAPVRLRTPYFGLACDTLVAPNQRLKITGSVVDYMFGTEAVLANASHLVGGIAAARVDAGPFITYHHVLLPRHQTIVAAGAALESLFIGRLRRRKDQLAATLLQDLDRSRLPEHSGPAFPILRQYDALVLAEQRSA